MDPAIAAWAAGVLTWLCALGFDYRKRGSQFESDKREVETRLRLGDLNPAVVGDVDEFVANNFGKPTLGDSASRTWPEPLFVSTIVGWTTIPGHDYIGLALGFQALVALILIGTTGAWSPWWMRTRYFIGTAWIAVFVVLAACSWFSQGTSEAHLSAWLSSFRTKVIVLGGVGVFLGGIVLGFFLRGLMAKAKRRQAQAKAKRRQAQAPPAQPPPGAQPPQA
jgi:hypothetical protein